MNWGTGLRNVSRLTLVVSGYLITQEKAWAKPFEVIQLQAYTMTIMSAHLPDHHMWASPGPQPTPIAQTQRVSDGYVKI